MQLIDRVYATEEPYVEMPNSLDELDKLTSKERRILMARLDRESGGPYVTAEGFRAALRREELEQLEELRRWDYAARRVLAKNLALLEAEERATRDEWCRKYPKLRTPIFDDLDD